MTLKKKKKKREGKKISEKKNSKSSSHINLIESSYLTSEIYIDSIH